MKPNDENKTDKELERYERLVKHSNEEIVRIWDLYRNLRNIFLIIVGLTLSLFFYFTGRSSDELKEKLDNAVDTRIKTAITDTRVLSELVTQLVTRVKAESALIISQQMYATQFQLTKQMADLDTYLSARMHVIAVDNSVKRTGELKNLAENPSFTFAKEAQDTILQQIELHPDQIAMYEPFKILDYNKQRLDEMSLNDLKLCFDKKNAFSKLGLIDYLRSTQGHSNRQVLPVFIDILTNKLENSAVCIYALWAFAADPRVARLPGHPDFAVYAGKQPMIAHALEWWKMNQSNLK
jgi:hypothetical protein